MRFNQVSKKPTTATRQGKRLSAERLEPRDLLAADVGENSLRCEDIASLPIPDAVIAQANVQGRNCVVRGVIDDTINFEVKLPDHDRWNGKFLMFGNGGFAGSIASDGSEGLERGYATAATDTGHSASGLDGSWALDNTKAIEDYAYRGIHLTAVTSKQIIGAFYDADIQHSYFKSFSNGGRQGMMESQRFPEDFDGIVAGGPAADFSRTTTEFLWIQQAMFPDAETLSSPALSSSKLTTLDAAVLTKCDALDGLEDGLIGDPRACTLVPAEDLPVCPEDVEPRRCRKEFHVEEIDALQRIFDGPSNSDGQLYTGFQPGGEFAGGGWADWVTRSSGGLSNGLPNLQYTFAQEVGRYFVFDDHDWNLQDFDFASDMEQLREATSTLNATNPDLSAFAASGGKLILYHGWADPAVNTLSTIEYYEQVERELGGTESVDEFMRLFLMPGATHGGDGSGPRSADWLSALEAWVEKGIAPDSIVTTGGEPFRTRPACAYPAQPVWDEVGNPNRANSFSCVEEESRLAGDIDDNGEVNFADFLILSNNFGNSESVWSEGDLNEDGKVEFTDFLILSENFGRNETPQRITSQSVESSLASHSIAANAAATDDFFSLPKAGNDVVPS